MTNVFHNSKIYKVWSPMGNKVYVGSTTAILSNALQAHIFAYRTYKKTCGKSRRYSPCFEIFETYGIDNVQIELLENVKCETKLQLNEYKNKHIPVFGDNCLNLYTFEDQSCPGKPMPQKRLSNKRKKTVEA